MKKAKTLLLCMLLAAAPAAGAAAENTVVPRAAAHVETAQFAYYPAYQADEAAGKWSVHSNEADALLDRFWDFGRRYNVEVSVFHTAIEGNLQTGVWMPVLKFYHMDGKKAINATSVSILVDGVRYDLAASSARVTNGRYAAEEITVPLTKEAVEAVKALAEGEEKSFRLCGDAYFTTSLDADSKSQRRVIASASLDGLEAGLQLLEDAGLSSYQLWDLSAEMWESEYGLTPSFVKTTVEKSFGGFDVDDDFGMILPETRGKAAVAAQEMLVATGFLNGKPGNVFDEKAAGAVRRAQQYLGLPVNGCMDLQLAEAIKAGRRAETKAEPVMEALGEEACVSLERYWFAGGVSASAGAESLRTVTNADNVFLAADGWLQNLSGQQMHLFMDMEARVICNGRYSYEASVVCECSDGRALDTVLLPLGTARVIVYAEVPVQLKDAEQLVIELTAGGETISFDLK